MNTIPEQFKIKNTVKYPTSILVGGVSALGFEIADTLIEQGGYVIIVDTFTPENIEKLRAFPKDTLISFVDYSSVPHLYEDIRRLDYVFYFNHDALDLTAKISTQEFLNASNTLDAILSLAEQFEAKFLLATSIKAQQLISSSSDINLTNHHITYSQMEMQRYSENLVQEYHDRTGLDTRIVRLGELIGEHADFVKKTTYNQLILDASSEKPLKLYKDGLEADWYVHTIDASYGIIKAQFSKGTAGEIYSISFDHPVTHLSVAYKIQELNEPTPEIIFVDEKNNLPSLSMYKPAPNLSVVGWKPKVSFEKCVKQSLLAAKVFILQDEKRPEERQGILKKLQNFIANDKDDLQNESAISRLIAERERQEKLKLKRIELASNITKKRRAYKPRTFEEKLKNYIWNRSKNLGESIKIFKHKSPLEIAIVVLSLALLVLVYFSIISPSILITKNLILLDSDVTSIEKNIENQNWQKAYESSQNASNNISSLKRSFKFLEPVFDVLSLDSEYANIQSNLNNYEALASGTQDILYYVNPLTEYLDAYEDNTQLRISSDTFISLENDGVNYEDYLLEMHSREAFLESGIQKVNEAKRSLPLEKTTFIPKFIREKLDAKEKDFLNFAPQIASFEQYKYLPTLLGSSQEQTYAIILLDNSLPKPIGGEISSVALLTLKNGSLNDVEILKPEDIVITEEAKDSVFLDTLNVTRFTPITTNDLNFRSLADIADFNSFSYASTEILKEHTGKNVNNIVTLTFQDLENLLKLLPQSQNTIVIGEVEITNSQILEALNTQVDLTKLDKEIIASQLLAQTISEISKEWGSDIFAVIDFVNSSYSAGSLRVKIDDDSVEGLIASRDPASLFLSDYYFKVYTSTLNQSIAVAQSYITTQYDYRMVLNNEGSASHTLKIQPKIVGSSEDITVCVPSNFTDFKLVNDDVNNLVKYISNEKCITANISVENDLLYSWKSETQVKDITEFSILLPAVNFSATNVDVELAFDSSLKISSENNLDLINSSEKYIFSDSVYRNNVYNFTLEK